MPKRVHHVVRRPGRRPEDPDVEIPVAEDLGTIPGIPLRERDLSFYSRVYPLEDVDSNTTADIAWGLTVLNEEMAKQRNKYDEIYDRDDKEADVSGELEPMAPSDHTRDVTEDIRQKAREIGFGEVGFTKYDRRYTYTTKKTWAKFDHAICLALEQDYVQTEATPSMESEEAHFGTYEIGAALSLKLASYIRSIGYHAQIHSPTDSSGAYIPMFVSAGLGQLGANGQLLSPHFGSRSRLTIVTTDAPVKHDKPIDYGINKFCQLCQVCVNRCPGRALTRDKIWWRGAEKNKVIYKQCFPIMSSYEGCGVCIKVCPIQRYGMKPVMEHYIATDQVLGKGTHNLEGYSMRGKVYFGPGEMPHFDRQLFMFPHGLKEDVVFHEFKKKLDEDGMPSNEELTDFATKVGEILEEKTSTTRSGT